MTEKEFSMIVSGTKRAVLGAIRQHLSPYLYEWIDDVAQETYLRLYRHLEKKGQNDSPETIQSLAYVIAKNESFRMNQKMGRVTIAGEQVERMAETLTDTTTIDNQHTKETLSAALSVLDDELAPVVSMTAEGYTTNEIASAMNIPPGTVKSRLYRARKKLKERAADWLGDGKIG